MPRKHYKADEIIQILRTIEDDQSKGLTLEEAAKKSGIAAVTASRWKREYGGLRVDQAKRLKELEHENARLKKIVAEQAIDNQILKEVAKGNF